MKFHSAAAYLVSFATLTIQCVKAGHHRHHHHPEGKVRAHPHLPKARSPHAQEGQLRSRPVPRVSPFLETRSVLVVRVITTTTQPTISRDVLSDKVFGTDGDQVNLKTQIAACSFNKFQVTPATGPEVVNGVTEVSVDFAAAGSDSWDVMTAVEEILKSRFGATEIYDIADQTIFVLPDGVEHGDRGTRWSAYADSYHRIWFNDEMVIYPDIQVHEMGHNLWLDHSNENGATYGDQSGAMGGNGLNFDEGAKARICFNPAKSWQLGWYSDKAVTVNPQQNGEYVGNLIGVNNYDKITGNDKMLLKIAGTSPKDYYIGFNHADGMNSGTREALNMVTVITQEIPDNDNWEYSLPSDLVAKLSAGQKFTTSTGVEIKVIEIDPTPSTGYAKVQICTSGSCSCHDMGSWEDQDGASCSDWTDHPEWCPTDGESYWDITTGFTAKQACCECGGGSGGPSLDVYVPSSHCENYSGWVDADGVSCLVWEKNHHWCAQYGDGYAGTNGNTPNDACCVCNGGNWE